METMDGKLTTDIATYLNVSSVAIEQFLALATAYGMNFLAAIFTLALGIWLSRRASRLLALGALLLIACWPSSPRWTASP